MIWLASFPRAGNTFFRNVLYEVYGIESSTFHKDPDRELDANYDQYQVIKTHLLPDQLVPDSKDIKSVYLIRDGRDSLVSIAHHRKDLVVPGSDYYNNLLDAILALGGSFFGGWSENVRQWTERADIIIRFEDLIKDPVKEVEKLRTIMDLPEPDLDKLPTFKDLKFGTPRYGAGAKKGFKQRQQKHFRKGKVGSYKEEMPEELEELFWDIHSEMMDKWGYTKTKQTASVKRSPYKVLFEVSKVFTADNDGVKRYVVELIEHMLILLDFKPNLKVDFFYQDLIMSIDELQKDLQERGLSKFKRIEQLGTEHKQELVRLHEYESSLLKVKAGIKKMLPIWIYQPLSNFYRNGPFRVLLRKMREEANKKRAIQARNEKIEQFAAYDLIHVPLPQHLDRVSHLKNRFLVTIHDMTHKLFPEFHKEDNIRLAEKGMDLTMKLNADVLAISEATKEDVNHSYKKIAPEKTHLVLEGASRGKFNLEQRKKEFEPVRKQYQLPAGKFLMCLSTIEPRKNLINTIKAFLLLLHEYPNLEAQLFICGKKGWKFEELFEDETLQSGHIHFTGFVDDEHLPLFYANAEALCYVSYYEGFGLPPVEAMSCGTPVIYGNNSSMPEVVGEGGLPADPDNIEEIKTQMYRLLSDKDFRDQKAQLAWEQANTFSWLKAALQTLNVYKQIIDRK